MEMAPERIRLGIDVGGTNTDAVLMCGKEVLATTKSFTTVDVKEGVIAAVRALLSIHGGAPALIDALMIGTTQFVNAFVQRRDLSPVAAIRVGLPAGDGVPPFSGWPDDAREAVGGRHYLVGGGSFYSGKDYAPLDEDAIAAAATEAGKAGVTTFALSATFRRSGLIWRSAPRRSWLRLCPAPASRSPPMWVVSASLIARMQRL